MRSLFQPVVNYGPRHLVAAVCAAALLYVGAGVGMAYVAGFDEVRARLENPDWPWFFASMGGVALAFLGYYWAYRGVQRVEGGPALRNRKLRAVVTAGFGTFVARGGPALDKYALEATGAGERDAKVRVTALGGFELGVLAIGACLTAIALLAEGVTKPSGDFTWPWAVAPPLGFAIGYWAVRRYRHRMRDRSGWQGALGIFLDAAQMVLWIFRRPGSCGYAMFGLALFWAADIFAVWAGMAAFRFHMDAGGLIVGYATGYVLTRRTAPLGGAGLITTVLSASIWYSGAPWSAAVLGVFAYRFFSLWLPMPFGLASIRELRAIGGRDGETPARAGAPRPAPAVGS